MHEATLVFRYPSDIAAALMGALAPEADHSEVPKTRAAVRADDSALVVELRADDLAALRAAVNSYARWVEAGARAAASGATRDPPGGHPGPA
ncbi:MAG TPA: KEOPS complex subunit Pcc1 [Candidatus Thermoplasmatota archaeon]|nr:KEOPS complex subunit Pcc1 [Candidatus Thermoplasmatota archaeon]